jgi:hypothetical protein
MQTARTLSEIGLKFNLVIEKQEKEKYEAALTNFGIKGCTLHILPFSNLGLGGIPARNWVWDHATASGAERHWILDDNIRHFYRIYKNTKLRILSSVPLRVCEDYADRFENVPMAGLQYNYFVPSHVKKEAAYYNTRVYSCILLTNKTDKRWRVLEWDGKPAPFNEDTDLSLQFLKEGDCTILLNAFTCGKTPTHSMKGGNTEEVYKLGNKAEFDNRYTFAASLQRAHPEHVKIIERFGRWHHFVDYTWFQKNNKFRLKPGLEIPGEYDTKLKLVQLSDSSDINSSQTDIELDDIRMTLGDQ